MTSVKDGFVGIVFFGSGYKSDYSGELDGFTNDRAVTSMKPG